ncbi:hypothetical protein PRIPAC_84966 [Pristionchus pacificus]|nr:hypothetical protein PRIPAC_84966 [Pristionchus pacificus]
MEMENGDPSSGTIRFEIDNISMLTNVGRYSEAVEVEGVPCSRGHTIMRCSLGDFAWLHGYIKDGKLTVAVKFSLKNIMGIRRIARVDFSDKDEPHDDIALEIGGENYLSLHSPVFDAMFFGNFAEKKKKIVEIKDVDRQEFVELLKVIYPSQDKITDTNYKYFLSLADRFQIKLVIDKVEQHLISTTKLSIPEKLKLADDFRLVKLHDVCLDSFITVQDITKIKVCIPARRAINHSLIRRKLH